MPPDPPRPQHTLAPGDGEPPGVVVGSLAAAGVVIACCAGLPLLLGAGITLGAIGIAAGTALLIAAGLTLGLWAWRHRSNRDRSGAPRTHDPEDRL